MDTEDFDYALVDFLRIETHEGFLLVMYKSRKLQNTYMRYPINNKEHFTIFHCLEKCQCYLEGVMFIICLKGHNSLKYFNI